ncbi:hypothetical protein [Nonomuraea rubra]|uniref:hypothetical protein n=1 Tax=Nonomuraea rubra TaxID=46180 RepID=UPI0031EB4755
MDTTKLANGTHVLSATTAAGVTVKHKRDRQQRPGGARHALMPTDGTLVAGTKAVFATVRAAAAQAASRGSPWTARRPSPKATSATAPRCSPSTWAPTRWTTSTNNFSARQRQAHRPRRHVRQRRATVRRAGPLPDARATTRSGRHGDYKESCGNDRDDFTISNLP